MTEPASDELIAHHELGIACMGNSYSTGADVVSALIARIRQQDARIKVMDAALEWLSDGPHDAEKTYAELIAEFSRRARAARKEPTDG